VSYLHNFLEPYEDLIKNLILRLTDLTDKTVTAKTEVNSQILKIIKDSLTAEFALVISYEQDKWIVKFKSDDDDISSNIYLEIINSIILSSIFPKCIFNPAYHGIYKIYENSQRISKAIVFIPLKTSLKSEMIVVCGLPQDSFLLEDVCSLIVSTFYQSSQTSFVYPSLVEAAILDELKKTFGFVSASLYNRRLNLFLTRLQGMIVYFEPVLHLDLEYLFISGWEALARNPDSFMAPVDLFQAAELWGSSFIVELDKYFLKCATKSYRLNRSKQRRVEDIVPLSVNVYPESLMHSEYFETVRQILVEQIIFPRNLILEISEKTELPKLKDGMVVFKNVLLEYVRQLKIRFAIDDFGVGYASVSRLAGLNPSYVKIDRDILYHPPSDVIIRFVHELVTANNLNPSNVIVEGVDESVPLSLRRLKEFGVTYIQGHIVGKPAPEIYRLSQEKVAYLKKLILEY
jgi:EAL domain-containing protein (putative c-di-GMP-specific phosphodiesterase class I)